AVRSAIFGISCVIPGKDFAKHVTAPLLDSTNLEANIRRLGPPIRFLTSAATRLYSGFRFRRGISQGSTESSAVAKGYGATSPPSPRLRQAPSQEIVR